MDFISSLNIVARLPPAESDAVVADICTICPKLRKFLTSRVDSRLQLLSDESSGKIFVASDFNQVGRSYRSPWSNTYIPSPDSKSSLYFPPESLRSLEQGLNELLLTYCNLYYDNGVGSAFFAQGSDSGIFNGVVLIMKEVNEAGESHVWESVHSFEISSRSEGPKSVSIDCVMSSTVVTVFDYSKGVACKLSGSVQKRSQKNWTIPANDMFDESVIRTIGELVEDHENTLRGTIDKVAIPRCLELALASFGVPDNDMDVLSSSEDESARASLGTMNPLRRLSRTIPAFQADLMGAVAQRRLTRSGGDDNEI